MDGVKNVVQSIILSDDVTVVQQYILLSSICQLINIFGIASNIINIICLLRQDMADPINISFLGTTFLNTRVRLHYLPISMYFRQIIKDAYS